MVSVRKNSKRSSEKNVRKSAKKEGKIRTGILKKYLELLKEEL